MSFGIAPHEPNEKGIARDVLERQERILSLPDDQAPKGMVNAKAKLDRANQQAESARREIDDQITLVEEWESLLRRRDQSIDSIKEAQFKLDHARSDVEFLQRKLDTGMIGNRHQRYLTTRETFIALDACKKMAPAIENWIAEQHRQLSELESEIEDFRVRNRIPVAPVTPAAETL